MGERIVQIQLLHRGDFTEHMPSNLRALLLIDQYTIEGALEHFLGYLTLSGETKAKENYYNRLKESIRDSTRTPYTVWFEHNLELINGSSQNMTFNPSVIRFQNLAHPYGTFSSVIYRSGVSFHSPLFMPIVDQHEIVVMRGEEEAIQKVEMGCIAIGETSVTEITEEVYRGFLDQWRLEIEIIMAFSLLYTSRTLFQASKSRLNDNGRHSAYKNNLKTDWISAKYPNKIECKKDTGVSPSVLSKRITNMKKVFEKLNAKAFSYYEYLERWESR